MDIKLAITNPALSKIESRYNCLLNAITNYVYTVKVNDGIAVETFHSPSCEAVTGYKIEDYNIDPELWYKMIYKDDRQIVIDQVDKLLSGKTVTPIEHRIYNKNGNITWIRQTLVPHYDEDSNLVEYDGLIENITVRKVAEEALQGSEKKYRKIFEHAVDIYYQVSLDGIITDVSPSVFRHTGYTREELIGKSIEVFYADPGYRKTFLNRILIDNEVIDYEIELKSKKGEPINASVNAHVVPDEAGNPIAIEGSIRNVTERKYTETHLKKLNQAVQQSPASIIITNIEGIIEYVNPKFSTLTGYMPEEVIGKKARILKPEKIKPYDFNEVWNDITNGKAWSGEFINRKKNNEMFWESVLISPITNEKGEVTNFLIITEDVTEKKQYVKELIEAKETAEKSDKLKSEFLEQMSHEIRTPINAIINFTHLLKEELSGDESAFKEYFDIINDSSKRIIRTIEMILSMSEIQTGNYNCSFEPVNLNKDIIKKTFGEYVVAAKKKKLDYNLVLPDKDFVINGDKHGLKQIFLNLIDNAIVYTKHGKVEVSCFTDEHNFPCVSVADTGIGINDDFLPDLFKPFRQEDQGYTRRYDGNGLGLALAKHYCKMNNAEISVTSKKNVGTTFTVKFLNSHKYTLHCK